MAFINEQSTRTIHGFHCVSLFVNVCKIHILFIVIPMSAFMPELFVQNNRCADFFISISIMNTPPEINNRIPDDHSLWMDECKTGTGFIETE